MRDVAKHERSVKVSLGDDVNVFVNGVYKLSFSISRKKSLQTLRLNKI